MRLLAASDMHGYISYFKQAVLREPEAATVVFLGDGAADAQRLSQQFTEKNFIIIKGNCDSGPFPALKVFEFAGIKILACHGHEFSVKHTLLRLKRAAAECGAKIALYGHNHRAAVEYEDGLYLINPGAFARPKNGCMSYAVIDIGPHGIVPVIKKI